MAMIPRRRRELLWVVLWFALALAFAVLALVTAAYGHCTPSEGPQAQSCTAPWW